MLITLISAVGKENVIGLEGTIPWKVPGELKYFKNVTEGCPCIMGRKTFDSLPGPLPDRLNIVVTSTTLERPEGSNVVDTDSIESALLTALKWATINGSPRIIIMGWERIYEAFLPIAHELLITWVPYEGPGDTFFPVDFDKEHAWKLVEGHDFKGTDGICRYARNPYANANTLGKHIPVIKE